MRFPTVSKKTRAKREKRQKRVRGKPRRDVVLSIVATDMTFVFHQNESFGPGTGIWIGRCIHCGRKLGVGHAGATDATVEHINPLCNDGDSVDPRNLALACKGCNNEKGVRHDKHAGKGGRADEVITALQGKRLARWREPVTDS